MHDAAPSTTRARKPKRRPPAATGAPATGSTSGATSRLRSRAGERSHAASNSGSPPSGVEQPRRAPPPPHAWVPDDFVAMAREVHAHASVEFERFFGGSHPKLPPQLARKARGDVIALMRRLANFGDVAAWVGRSRCDAATFTAVLAAERAFVQMHNDSSDAAMQALGKARADRHRVQSERGKLALESKALAEQMRMERAARSKLAHAKTATDSSLLSSRTRYTQLRNKYRVLSHTLCKAKLSELEARRRLDRLQLKISALLGDVIIPTLDTLSPSQPQWLADTHIPLVEQQRDAELDEQPQRRALNAGDAQQPNIPERSGSPFVGYDQLLQESKEEQQLRLLKYRLRMCEMETNEWRQSLSYEQQRIRLISRARTRLEEDVQRQKQANREWHHAKLTTPVSRSASKSGGAGVRTIAKIRAAVRASLPSGGDSGGGATKVIAKKTRKGRVVKSLSKTRDDWS